jgi:hypothetical protein
MSSSDVAFLAAALKAGVSDPPTSKQLRRMYETLEASLMMAVHDFGVEELNQMIAAAKAIRARRPGGAA